MTTLTEHRQVPFDRRQIFDLVADVERYPAFLPRILASRIRHREGNTVHVDMLLGFGILRRRIASVGTLAPPAHIDIVSHDAPFARFALHWRFEPTPNGGTNVSLTADFAFRARLWERFLAPYLRSEMQAMVDAFERRANVICVARS